MPRGRKAKTVEHLSTLIDWAGGKQGFEQLTGITVSEQDDYLAGNAIIPMNRLKKAGQQIFSPGFEVLAERDPLPTRLPNNLKRKGGLYALFSSSGALLYFGKATNLHFEINQTLNRNAPKRLVVGTANAIYTFRQLAHFYSAYHVIRGDSDLRHDLEALVIRTTRSDTLNTQGAHFKRTC